MPNTGSFTKHLNKNCTCSAERKKEILDHISSESSHHVTSEGETAWSFDVALPHHIRWVLKTIYNSNSLDSGADEYTRRLSTLKSNSFFFLFPFSYSLAISIVSLLGSLGMDTFLPDLHTFITSSTS